MFFDPGQAYYAASGSKHRLPAVRVPLLCVQAEDDPIAVDSAIPRDAISANANCMLVTTKTGGHLGWITVGDESGAFGAPWPYPLVLEYFDAVLHAKAKAPLTAASAAVRQQEAPAPAPSH